MNCLVYKLSENCENVKNIDTLEATNQLIDVAAPVYMQIFNRINAACFKLIHCIYFVFLDTNYQGLANMYCCHAKERKMDRYHAIH